MAAVSARRSSLALAVVGMSFYWPLLRREQALLFSVHSGARGSLPSLEALPYVLLGVFVLAIVLGRRRVPAGLGRPRTVVTVCAVATLVNLTVLVWPSTDMVFVALQVFRSAASALSLLLLTYAWGQYFASDGKVDPAVPLAVSFTVSFVIPLIGMLPQPAAYVVPVVAPLCSAVVWYACGRSILLADDDGRPSCSALPMNTVGLLTAFLLLGGLVRGVFYSSELSSSFASVVPWLRGVSIGFSVLIVVASGLTRRRDTLFGIMLTALAALFFGGLFWVAALNSVGISIGVAAIIAGRTYFGFFLFTTLVRESARRGVSRACAFGLFAGVESLSGVLTYAIVPILVSHVGISSEEHIGVYSLFIALMLIVCCFIFFTRRGAHLIEAEDRPAVVLPDEVAVRERLALLHELTEREAEVLVLLAHGHNYKKIGELLYIAPNTVLSHTKRIYRKMGVHKKQQLIDLYDAATSEGDGSRASDSAPDRS